MTLDQLKIPERKELCNCGYFDLPHINCKNKFYPTDESAYQELLKNKDEFIENLKVIEKQKEKKN